MANQSNWGDTRRNSGGSYGANEDGRDRQARDYRDDNDGQASGYTRDDRRDDYRYGGGASGGYGYGQNRSFGSADYQNADRDQGRRDAYAESDRSALGGYGQRGGGQRGLSTEAYGGGDFGYNNASQGGAYGQGYGRGAYGQGGSNQGGYGGPSYGRSDQGRAAAYGYSQDDRFGHGGDQRRGQEPRSMWDRTSDEVSSWFGDDDAARRRRQDEIQAGQHRGRGPSDYTRSDERIREDVNDRLTDDPHIDASTINVQIKSGEITLSGTVKNRNDKRHAEDLAESVSGVKHVQNNLRVHDANYDAQASQSGSATAATGSASSTTGAAAGSTTGSTARTN